MRAAADENPDLFWAIRGGGGNFGIVTEFEFALHEVGPQIELGMLFYGMDQAADALRVAREVIPDLPPDVSFEVVAMSAPPEPFVPAEHHFRLVFVLVAVGTGSEESHRGVVDRVRNALTPLFEMVAPMPFTALQQMFDEGFAWGTHAYEKSLYLETFTDEAIEVIVERVAETVSPMSAVLFYVLGGAFSAADDASTAFSGGRSPRLAMFIVGMAPDARRAVGRARLGAGLLRRDRAPRHGHGHVRQRDGQRRRPPRAGAYGTKYARLQRIKAAYDPDNVFHRNTNILPAP